VIPFLDVTQTSTVWVPPARILVTVLCSFKTEKRAVLHSLPRGDRSSMTALAQLTHSTSERELVTGTSDGRLIFWDGSRPAASVGELSVAAQWRGGGEDEEKPANPADFRVLAVRVSPSARFIAVLTAGGRVSMLQVRLDRCGLRFILLYPPRPPSLSLADVYVLWSSGDAFARCTALSTFFCPLGCKPEPRYGRAAGFWT
jgi:hypothetical protein